MEHKKKGRVSMRHLRILTPLVLVISISLIFAACDDSQNNHETPTTSTPTEAPTEASTQNNTEHTHVFSEATCTTPMTCECGETQGDPKGHSYVDVVTAPTCTEAGYTTHTCECGDNYTDTSIEALDHAFENGTCGVCDEADPDFIAHTHNYISVVITPTCTTKGFTTHTCACGVTYSDHTIDTPGHKYENGVCKACGETDPYYVPHSHSYTSVVIAPTCIKTGYTTYTCECGDSYIDSEVAALGHGFENGLCRTCGEADPDHDTPHSHSYSSVVSAPTCIKAGYTTYTCECGDSYINNEVAALGHMFDKGVCVVCGEVHTDYVPPVLAIGKADFNTISTGTASGGYSNYDKSYTTTDGWTTINTAIQVGGATDINPAYTVVGPDNTYKAVCLNGKTSAPGKLTSSTITGGISKLNLTYTKMFTDTKLSVSVIITELSTGKTYTQVMEKTALRDEKYIIWEFEWVLEAPINGNFTIEVVNNCPSNSTNNKDRFTILSLEWTSAA